MNASREETVRGELVLRLSRLISCSRVDTYLALMLDAGRGELELPPAFPAREGQRQVIERAIAEKYDVPLNFTWSVTVTWEPVRPGHYLPESKDPTAALL